MAGDEEERRVRLAEITERICRAVGAAEDGALLEAVSQTNAYVGTGYDERGVTSTFVPLAEHFSNLTVLRRALEVHAFEARAAAVLLLAAIDPAALLPDWRLLIGLSKRGFHAMSWAGEVARAASQVWHTMVALLPPEELGEMFLRGETSIAGVPDSALFQLSVSRLIAAIRDGSLSGLDHEGARRLASHPELASVEQKAALLTELLSLPKPALARYAWVVGLLEQLGASADDRALEALLLASSDEDARYRASADAALIALHHLPSLERIGRGVADAAAKGDLKWDPHHVAPQLQLPIQAVFAIAPETAVDRFAPYFTDEALRDDAGAKLACDVLMIGRGVLVAHRGVRIGAGDERWLEADPRWREVGARLSSHRRLGPVVAPLIKAWRAKKASRKGPKA